MIKQRSRCRGGSNSLVTVTASGKLPPIAKPVAARSATYAGRLVAHADAIPSTAVRPTEPRKAGRRPATSARRPQNAAPTACARLSKDESWPRRSSSREYCVPSAGSM